MMIEGGIADEVRRESIAGPQNDARTENKGIEEEATSARREAKEKLSTRICLKGRRKKKNKLKAMRLKINYFYCARSGNINILLTYHNINNF